MLIKGPVENLDDSDSDESLSDFVDKDEEVSNLRLRETPRSLLFYLRAWRERLARGHYRSMPGLSLLMELRLHNLLIFQLGHELICHQSRVNDLEDQLYKRSGGRGSWPSRWS